jgi:hypothetical protein
MRNERVNALCQSQIDDMNRGIERILAEPEPWGPGDETFVLSLVGLQEVEVVAALEARHAMRAAATAQARHARRQTRTEAYRALWGNYP